MITQLTQQPRGDGLIIRVMCALVNLARWMLRLASIGDKSK